MKKIASILCMIFMLCSMVLPASAQETAKTEDSVTIPEEVLSCLDMETVETVFCVYSFEDQFVSCWYEGFAIYGDINSVLANADALYLQRYYLVKYLDGETSVYNYDGANLIKGHTWGSGWFSFHKGEAASVIKRIDSEIAVEHIYYLLFENWSAVCYKTNLGDYVYIMSGKKEYLMGLKPFMALQGELRDMAIKYKDWRNMDNESYHIKLSNISVDLSPYDITSPDFDPHAPLKTNFKPGKFIAIGSFVLLMALIVGRILIRNRRKTMKNTDIPVNRL